ncbi:MAG: DUF2167 domain-containing protein [Bacteroidetes bacterium]|nr:DUF2167 domain-containing protein [Bacteroidota bacterium]
MKKTFLFISLIFCLSANVFSQDDVELDSAEMEAYLQIVESYYDSLESTFNYEYGQVEIGDGLATINVPEGFKYLNGEGGEIILTEFWGNPPTHPDNLSLGMLMPADRSPMDDEVYAINITFVREGFVDDSDAAKIDFDELLETLKEDTQIESEQQVEMGYEAVELVGWAQAPFYDQENKKLHWALDLVFGDTDYHTLNYNIRILGRRGFLRLNVIGGMESLPEVNENIERLLSSVSFQEGHRYEDFDSNVDEIAAYGIGGLIAGKVLLKAGLFAKLGIFLAKAWKLIALGVVAAVAGVRRFMGGRNNV